MSDAQKLIADVQRQHRRTLSLDDGLSYCQGARAGQCNYLGGDLSDFEAHVAAEIDKALGGLTREEQWVPVEQSGHRWQPRDQALALAALDLYGARGPMHAADIDSPVDRIDHESRWVSGWSEVQS